jgi:hypothetical protein
LLAEMIKLSHMDVGLLVDFAKSHGIQPDWLRMQLPGGKHASTSRAQCKPLTYRRRAQHEPMSPCGRGHVRHANAAAVLGLGPKAKVAGRSPRRRPQQTTGRCLSRSSVAARVSAGPRHPACSGSPASEYPTAPERLCPGAPSSRPVGSAVQPGPATP